MKLRDIDLKQLKSEDLRLRAIKEQRFDELGFDNWILGFLAAYFIACGILMAACVAVVLS